MLEQQFQRYKETKEKQSFTVEYGDGPSPYDDECLRVSFFIDIHKDYLKAGIRLPEQLYALGQYARELALTFSKLKHLKRCYDVLVWKEFSLGLTFSEQRRKLELYTNI